MGKCIAPPFLTFALDESGQIHAPASLSPVPIVRWLGGPLGHYEEKNLLPIPGIEPLILGYPARGLVAIPTLSYAFIYTEDISR
jgi:hypothetical protein